MVFKLKKNEEVREEGITLVGNVDSNENDSYVAKVLFLDHKHLKINEDVGMCILVFILDHICELKIV